MRVSNKSLPGFQRTFLVFKPPAFALSEKVYSHSIESFCCCISIFNSYEPGTRLGISESTLNYFWLTALACFSYLGLVPVFFVHSRYLYNLSLFCPTVTSEEINYTIFLNLYRCITHYTMPASNII